MKESSEEVKEINEKEIEEINDGELATIEKLTMQNRQASTFEFDQIELSPDTANAESILDQELISAAQNTNLFEYEEAHLAKRYKGFFKVMTPEEIMQWQNSLIRSPLLRLSSSLEEIAERMEFICYYGLMLSSFFRTLLCFDPLFIRYN